MQEADLHGGHAHPEAGVGIREAWGSQAQAWGLRRQHSWGISAMAWALLLLTLLTQGSGEASREGKWGVWADPLPRPQAHPGPSTELTRVCFCSFRVLGPVSPHSAFLRV